jgi:hypothetical protein
LEGCGQPVVETGVRKTMSSLSRPMTAVGQIEPSREKLREPILRVVLRRPGDCLRINDSISRKPAPLESLLRQRRLDRPLSDFFNTKSDSKAVLGSRSLTMGTFEAGS